MNTFAQRILARRHPFRASKEKRILYHVTRSKFEKIKRPAYGIFLSTVPSSLYGGIVIPVYADIRKYLQLDEAGWEDAVEVIANRDYAALAKLMKLWSSQGYDAYEYLPGPTMPKSRKANIVVQPYVPMVRADTGEPL